MKQQEKLLKFRKAVFEEIDQKTAQIREEALQTKNDSLRRAEDALLTESDETLRAKTAEIRQNARKEAAKSALDAKRALLKKRMELTEKVFAQAAEKLAAYTKTEDYHASLIRRIADFSKAHPTSDPVLSVGEADFQYADELRAAFGRSCELLADNKITLGGFIVFDRTDRLYYDETFAQKLAEQKPYFIEHSSFTF